MGYNGLHLGLGNLSRLSSAVSRSISPENLTGEKGMGGMATEGTGAEVARDLGRGWKVSPSLCMPPHETLTLADITGPGVIQSIWMTVTGHWRFSVLRIYWDDENEPSVEVPVGDFFAMGWERFAQINSIPIAVNPGSGFNCYWEMPFRKRARITIENLDDKQQVIYFQINYALTHIPDDVGMLHAQFRRSNPVAYKEVHTLLDGVSGQGQFVGTYIAWGVNNSGWWGEGEIKFYIDDDGEFPTICGTGTEDYFGGSYDFVHPRRIGQYQDFSAPFSGLPQIIRPDGVFDSQQRFGMYRWHIMDPVRFEHNLRVTIQALGWRYDHTRYLPLRDDLASTVFWYQTEPHGPFPPLADKEFLEVI